MEWNVCQPQHTNNTVFRPSVNSITSHPVFKNRVTTYCNISSCLHAAGMIEQTHLFCSPVCFLEYGSDHNSLSWRHTQTNKLTKQTDKKRVHNCRDVQPENRKITTKKGRHKCVSCASWLLHTPPPQNFEQIARLVHYSGSPPPLAASHTYERSWATLILSVRTCSTPPTHPLYNSPENTCMDIYITNNSSSKCARSAPDYILK